MPKREPLKDGMFKDGFNFSKPVAAPVEESVKVEVEETVPDSSAGEVSPSPEEVSVPESVSVKSVRKGRRSSGDKAEKAGKRVLDDDSRTHLFVRTRSIKRIRLLRLLWNNCQGTDMSLDDFFEVLADDFCVKHKSDLQGLLNI